VRELRERPEFQRGHAAELLVAGWMQGHDYYVIPSYDYAGTDGDKAPRLSGKCAGYVVPDLDVSKDGRRFWAEIKAKASPVIWRMTGQKRHGIELRHLDHYRTVQAITGNPCWLLIYEEDTNLLIGETLDALGEPVSIGSDGRGKKIAFWPRGRFRRLALLDPIRLPGRQDYMTVGHDLYREVVNFAPDDLSPGELVVAWVIADDARDATRKSWISNAELCRRSRMKPSGVRAALGRLARADSSSAPFTGTGKMAGRYSRRKATRPITWCRTCSKVL